MTRPDASVVIAAFDEEATVAESVRRAARLPGVLEVVVADDGSRDRTAASAAAAGARVLRLPHRGKGEAVRAALREVRGEIVLLVDGDLGPAVGAFGPLLTAVREGRADMAVARLRPPEGRGGRGRGGFGLALGLARWGVRHLGGVAMEAPLSGQRAIRREVLAQVDLEGGFGLEVGLDIDLARLGARILEVPIAVDAAHAVTGRTLGGFLHRGRQFLAVARALWRRRRR